MDFAATSSRDLAKATSTWAYKTMMGTVATAFQVLHVNQDVIATLEAVSRAGDTVQRGLVDLMFGVLSLGGSEDDRTGKAGR